MYKTAIATIAIAVTTEKMINWVRTKFVIFIAVPTPRSAYARWAY